MESYIRLGKYQHYKGQYYEVLDIVRHSEDDSLLVLYKPLYGDQSLWVRPIEMFQESVNTNKGLVERFRFVDTDSDS